MHTKRHCQGKLSTATPHLNHTSPTPHPRKLCGCCVSAVLQLSGIQRFAFPVLAGLWYKLAE